MQDLLQDPRWQPEDLGLPLPDSEHAVSVCMPTWDSVIGYEEGRPEILEKLFCGYPRFCLHTRTTRLFDWATERFGREGEQALVFPCPEAAERAAEYVGRTCPDAARLLPGVVGEFSLLLVTGEEAFSAARRYWRFSGEVVSSRQAVALVHDKNPAPRARAHEDATAAHAEIRQRIAEHAGQAAEDVYLFPSGMAAIFSANRMLAALSPGLPTVQCDFPYVDVLKVQQEFGGAAPIFLPHGSPDELDALGERISEHPIAGIFGELPSNPLLRCADTSRLRQLADLAGAPLVLDDTIGTSINIDAASVADVVSTSLTKYFSGAGDVLAGALLVVRGRPYYEELSRFLREAAPVGLCREDAEVLAVSSRDFAERVGRINHTGSVVAEFLAGHPKVSQVFYPSLTTPDTYRAIARPGAGGAGLLSIVLEGGEPAAQDFYDRLRISKGPSLGTNFSLACPYTLLAHYDELDEVAALGVPRHLVRLAVGLEDPDDLLGRLSEALE